LDNYHIKIANYIKENTDRNDLILIFDDDWNSVIPYYSNRKAMMMANGWFDDRLVGEMNKYELIIMSNNSLNKEERLKLLDSIIFEPPAIVILYVILCQKDFKIDMSTNFWPALWGSLRGLTAWAGF
jgi:hypothetical protein